MGGRRETDDRTLFVSNLDEKVTDELLYELFLQSGPVKPWDVSIKKRGGGGGGTNFAFVTFEHEESVPYAVAHMAGVSLFDRKLVLKPREGSQTAEKMRAEAQRGRGDRDGRRDGGPSPAAFRPWGQPGPPGFDAGFNPHMSPINAGYPQPHFAQQQAYPIMAQGYGGPGSDPRYNQRGRDYEARSGRSGGGWGGDGRTASEDRHRGRERNNDWDRPPSRGDRGYPQQQNRSRSQHQKEGEERYNYPHIVDRLARR